MDYLPLFLDLRDQPCLVVGGGEVALRKIQSLVRSQASVTVIAPLIEEEIKTLVSQHNGQLIEREFSDKDLGAYRLIVAATDDSVVNERVSSLAKAAGSLVNVVDQPDLSNCIMPAVIDRDPIVVAISSGGKAPVLARQLRANIESLVPAEYGKLASLAGRFRAQVKRKIDDIRHRRRFWEGIFHGPAGELSLRGQHDAAEKLIEKTLNNFDANEHKGEVFLVGAGPGDPDLLTFRALRLMQQADIVLYDRLVSDGIMDLVRKDATRVYVGKRRTDHAVPQENINELLVKYAKEGNRVLRLKGGDPFIFGRGGEEIEELAAHNIPFQVVPGITAASGCASYSGIPLTHRDHAQSVRFITGHLKNGRTNLDFASLVEPNQTLVFYMGLLGLAEICAGLIQHGRDANTPAALIEKGTTSEQRVLISTLEELPDVVANKDVSAPTLLIIGGVVTLHNKLKWFSTTQ